ncbi:glycosyltransferase [Aeromonas veronii]|uniref:glycosyltransferase n=1 Tax=Aeromonas veronii TaxID=654 RepID=UPI0029D78C46|nr:glycosyltransferase [Aeromonas veronii]MDX7874975.1 glycosyltransferase [Aeromonas veronii]
MKASVIVAFYNNLKALKIILSALNNQFEDNFEVIIADDGSREDVVSEIKSIQTGFSYHIKHVWHEDKGFRKNKILNQAVLLASNEYIIFIDGDCIPQANFVRDHLENAEVGCFLNGRRADLSPSFSQKITLVRPESFFKENLFFILAEYIFLGKGKNIEKGIRITNRFLSRWLNRKNKGVVGCNFSLYKKDLTYINGFDERYEAAGVGEDTDVEFRLKLAGFRCKNIFYLANQVHIYHKELPRDRVNDEIYASVVKSGEYFTPWGIEKKAID